MGRSCGFCRARVGRARQSQNRIGRKEISILLPARRRHQLAYAGRLAAIKIGMSVEVILKVITDLFQYLRGHLMQQVRHVEKNRRHLGPLGREQALVNGVLAKLLPQTTGLRNGLGMGLLLFDRARHEAPEVGVLQRCTLHGGGDLVALHARY